MSLSRVGRRRRWGGGGADGSGGIGGSGTKEGGGVEMGRGGLLINLSDVVEVMYGAVLCLERRVWGK